MNLKAQGTELLTALQDGTRIDRASLILFLRAVLPVIPEQTQPARIDDDPDPDRVFTRKEATPIRMTVTNWNLTKCKRCLQQGAPDGSVIVRIFGVGWWHDDCYRHVNPDFYKGLTDERVGVEVGSTRRDPATNATLFGDAS